MEPQEIVFADRSERAKLRFTGPQRLWFLHQILTQSFEDLGPRDVREAALLTPHGRMVGYLESVSTDEAVLCHFEAELKETLPDAIARYVLATQVEIEDVTDEFGLVLVAGEGWDEAARGHAAELVMQPTRALGIPAAYLWVGRSELQALLLALEQRGYRPADEDELEAIRIAHGVARWGRDMDAKTFPQEVAIDDWAVHYDKGCYVGQEAMAKIHFRGKVNRALRKLSAAAGFEAGQDVFADDERVGVVTSASPREGRALALLRHTVEPGTTVRVGELEAEVVA